ncbi:MAG: hypothetical protein JXA13_17210 [Anaerolineales bacterium]|nr:hypothetical protein [Anaerolineales bacterium]
MASNKFDGVIEAVRFTPNKKIEIVRAYERRLTAFSDRVLLDRSALLEQMEKGKHFVTGARKEYLAGTFEVNKPVRMVKANGKYFITTREDTPAYDDLGDTPIF